MSGQKQESAQNQVLQVICDKCRARSDRFVMSSDSAAGFVGIAIPFGDSEGQFALCIVRAARGRDFNKNTALRFLATRKSFW